MATHASRLRLSRGHRTKAAATAHAKAMRTPTEYWFEVKRGKGISSCSKDLDLTHAVRAAPGGTILNQSAAYMDFGQRLVLWVLAKGPLLVNPQHAINVTEEFKKGPPHGTSKNSR